MSYTPLQDTFRVVSITACGTALGDPIGGSIDTTVEFLENRPGTRLSPATCIQSFSASGTAKYQTQQAPVTPGTAGSFVVTVLGIDGSTSIAVTLATCIAGGTKMDFNSEKHSNTFDCRYNAGNTENLAPVSVG